jgi:hypothetical protein
LVLDVQMVGFMDDELWDESDGKFVAA